MNSQSSLPALNQQPSQTATWYSGLLILLTLLAYGPVLTSSYVWDDDLHLTNNPQLRSWDGLVRIWTNPTATRFKHIYPLTQTSFWLEYHLWGIHPAGYHIVNVCLHVGSALILWRILHHLQIPGALLAAFCFALHPINVESVAWITERKNTLYGLFYLAALYLYLCFYQKKQWHFYCLAAICYVLALTAKTVACSWPAVILVIIWWRQGRLKPKDILLSLPFFALGLYLGLMTAMIEKTQLGACGPEWNFSAVQRLLIAARAWWFYPLKIIWPHPLIFIYPRWSIDALEYWQWSWLAAGVLIALLLWLGRQRLGYGPLTAVMIYSINIFPALGFCNIYFMRYSFVADHFQYLAGIAIMVLLSAGAARLATHWSLAIRIWSSATMALLLAALTWQQASDYHDAIRLWLRTLERNPQAWVAHNNLGKLYLKKRDFSTARYHYRQALILHPDSEGYNNLGVVYSQIGLLQRAIECYRQAITLNPSFAKPYYNWANVCLEQARLDRARQLLRQAVKHNPGYLKARRNLALVEVALHNYTAAIAQYKQILALRPNHKEIHWLLAQAYEQAGQYRKAARHYCRARQLGWRNP